MYASKISFRISMLNEYNALLGEEPRDGVATKLCLREMMDNRGIITVSLYNNLRNLPFWESICRFHPFRGLLYLLFASHETLLESVSCATPCRRVDRDSCPPFWNRHTPSICKPEGVVFCGIAWM
jgi:hypothetical protein